MAWLKNLFGHRRRMAGRIFVYGYLVTPGSRLHCRVVEALRLEPDVELERDLNADLPDGKVLEELAEEWAVLGHGVVSDEQRRAMHDREKKIGQILYDLGGNDLMRSFAYRLIDAGRSYESDFSYWHGIGSWRN